MDESELRRLEASRAALLARFAEKMRATPSLADPAPKGEGPRNAHGMPRMPVQQGEQDELIPMDLGRVPAVAMDRWKLTVDGAVEAPVTLGFEDLLALPQEDRTADFHCVTGWSVLGLSWRGVPVSTLLALARPTAEATHAMFHSHDGYSTNLPLEEALKDDVLLVHALGGAPLTAELGGPARVITPQLYAYKGAKWVNRIELLTQDRRGYWEIRGYSNTAYPWRNDREW
ncbi:molybdopterin-dependent oxidoreductase [Anaeromyxobacter paludicola]|uniref:Sulfite oxidase n=1 Tax=Anaeromyxobacter paludicola TaxID=2918171 RepID=A0ABN6NCM7_9BACT|nr:molybdopterin-dependent oxidoreductase [Anaeromyxobacter paludicola]BDG10098.1 sulfite oxidase [Anaeromyxobacter paludicola]